MAGRPRKFKLPPAHVERKLKPLRSVDALLADAMKWLDLIDRHDVEFSITQAKEGVANARKWVEDAMACLKIDNGMPADE